MTQMKQCPYCNGFHYKKSAAKRCAKKHKKQSWSKSDLK